MVKIMNLEQDLIFRRAASSSCRFTLDEVSQVNGSVKNAEGSNLLSWAVEKRNTDLVNLILRLPQEKLIGYLRESDARGRHPLEVAVYCGEKDAFYAILKTWPQCLNYKNTKTGNTVMHKILRDLDMGVASEATKDMYELSGEFSPDLSIMNNRGESPSCAASRFSGVVASP